MPSTPTLFQSTLPLAFYNGAGLYVLAAETRAVQRTYTHSYPFDDQPYAEPIGRTARQYIVTGFLVGDFVNFEPTSPRIPRQQRAETSGGRHR